MTTLEDLEILHQECVAKLKECRDRRRRQRTTTTDRKTGPVKLKRSVKRGERRPFLPRELQQLRSSPSLPREPSQRRRQLGSPTTTTRRHPPPPRHKKYYEY